MKGHRTTGWIAVPTLLASAAFGSAQVNSVSASVAQPNHYQKYVVSARVAGPGTINYVEGEAALNGNALSSNASTPANLSVGQTLTTANGYVELLLTPGAFLRVGPHSALRLDASGLVDTRVELLQGSTLLEVDQLIQGTDLTLVVNGATARIEKKGLYHFDASAQAINVLDGKVIVQAADRTQSLGKNDGVVLNAGPIKRHDINDKPIKGSELYVWSKARSTDESQANLAAASNPGYYPTAGPGWFWNGYAGGYGFWPVDSFLYSPFGGSFYSPAYFGYYGGFGYGGFGGYYRGYGRGFYGHPYVGTRSVGGINASVRSGFAGSGFHGGDGFHGGHR